MRLMSHLRVWVSIATAWGILVPMAAIADNSEAISLLTSKGGLSRGDAQKVATAVSARMAKSADNLAPPTDPLRITLSRALFGTDSPQNSMSAAKVRLRLFAGANAWSIQTLFAPGGGQIAACERVFSLSKAQCEGLVAAAGAGSAAQARAAESGAPVATACRRPDVVH